MAGAGSEERETPVYVWQGRVGGEPWASFAAPVYAGGDRVTLSAPIGWHLAPDPAQGVVLVNVLRGRLTAAEAVRVLPLYRRPGG